MTEIEVADSPVRPDLPAMLCVDDDPNVLDGFRRHLRKKFRVHTAVGPYEGLASVADHGPFGVIVSDFHMPGMNGVEFLTKARALAPDTVRIMLTGQADFSTAMGAVNQGNIFRFLVKPCSAVILEKVLEAGFEQHRLIVSERQLTEETLLGCVQMLVEVLSIVQPEAFIRSNRVRRYVKQVAENLHMPVSWQIEAAAMLSQIGCITLSPDLLAKASAGQALDEAETARFQKHASAAARILEKIPRLDQVAQIIEGQNGEGQNGQSNDTGPLPALDGSNPVGAGRLLLRAALDFDQLRNSGLSHDDVLPKMRQAVGTYHPQILEALATIEKTESQSEMRLVPLEALRPGMILEEELRGSNGILILGKGQEIPASFLQRLANFSYGLTSDHLCQVRIRPSIRASA